jgi:hypothetical protein
MATNNCISEEVLEQISHALQGILLHATAIPYLVIAAEDSAAGADEIKKISASCSSIDALANQIGYLADACLERIDKTASTGMGTGHWFGISLNHAIKTEDMHHG